MSESPPTRTTPLESGSLLPAITQSEGQNELIVTLDGPAGTGKSTVSRVLAHRAGLPHLDTGAFYRAATLAVNKAGVNPQDPGDVTRVVEASAFNQVAGHMYLDGVDVSDEIRGDAVTRNVSAVSSHPAVRDHMVGLQRQWIAENDGEGVVEGRDIGSVVFPDAVMKIYLDARPEVRARRRASQTGEDLGSVLEDQKRRDQIDSTRDASPLKVPDGAVVVDTSDLSFDEVVERLLELVKTKS